MSQAVLIGATLVACWLGMQAVHELGHVLAAWLTGGEVARVVLHPLTISRTDLSHNPQPLAVVWAGPVFGVLFPVVLWITAVALKMPNAFVLRFFAGFCLIANGAYIGLGSFGRIGDCGDMLRHGASFWHLWLFGIATLPLGLGLWNGQAKHFGIGKNAVTVPPLVGYSIVGVALMLVAIGVLLP